MKILLKSGQSYRYDKQNNRISKWIDNKLPNTDPIVKYIPIRSNVNTSKITMFTIEMTQECNLRCSYCCYSGNYKGRRQHNNRSIDWGTLSQTIEFITEHYDRTSDEITICFYGGEALLEKDKIKWVVDTLKTKIDTQIRFSLSTNGYALTESTIDWICNEPNFIVTITIDGDKDSHDANRKTISGTGSYDLIIKNIRYFKENFPTEYTYRVRFLSTVYSWKQVAKLSHEWNKSPVLNGEQPIRISHIIPNFSDKTRVYDTIENKDDFYSIALEEYKLGKDTIMVESLKELVNIVENREFFSIGDELEVKTCFNEMDTCYINANGDVYACEKFCDSAIIGNVESGFNYSLMNNIYDRFIERKNLLCSNCWASRLCRFCLTILDFNELEMPKLCNMEKDTLQLALKYYCEIKEYESLKLILKNYK